MNKPPPPEDPKLLPEARQLLRAIWDHEVSASMSGIEYYAEETRWLRENEPEIWRVTSD